MEVGSTVGWMFRFVVELIDALVWPLFMVTLIWLAYFLNHGYFLDWNEFGLRPRELRGLVGIVSMPFLHGNLDHLFSNTVPLLLSMGFLFLYFPSKRWTILWWAYIGTGGLLWILAEPPSNHIGASGMVYAFIFFMVVHALMNRTKETSAAALILIFLYGSLVYGIFPEYGRLIGKNISWEGHLSGMLIGIALAVIYRRSGPQRRQYFEDDEQEDDHDFFEEGGPDQDLHAGGDSVYRYHFRPRQ